MSDIVVKGMEMTSECRFCPLCRPNYYLKKVICSVTKELLVEGDASLEQGYRSKLCPLVELPEKHGRLVDADALIAKYGDWYTEEGTETGFIGTIGMLLKDVPTVVEAEGD